MAYPIEDWWRLWNSFGPHEFHGQEWKAKRQCPEDLGVRSSAAHRFGRLALLEAHLPSLDERGESYCSSTERDQGGYLYAIECSCVSRCVRCVKLHRFNTVTGDKNSVAAYEIDEMGIPVLYVNDGKGKGERVKLKSGLFHNGEWNTLELVLEPNGDVTPLVNGANAYRNTSDRLRVPVGDYPAGFVDGHAGIIAANEAPVDGLDGIWILNDNFEVLEYQ
jgi:hypothetical protein